MKIMDIEEAHPRRSRCSRFGEMIQMDASEYFWIDGEKCFQTNTRKLRNTIYVLHRPKDSI